MQATPTGPHTWRFRALGSSPVKPHPKAPASLFPEGQWVSWSVLVRESVEKAHVQIRAQPQVAAATFHPEIKSLVCLLQRQPSELLGKLPGSLRSPSPIMSGVIAVIRLWAWLYLGTEDPELLPLQWQVLYPLGHPPSPWRTPSHSHSCVLVLSKRDTPAARDISRATDELKGHMEHPKDRAIS